MKRFRRWCVNILLILLLLLGLALVFNKAIRNIFMSLGANRYQITKVDKKTLKDNDKKGKGNFDFSAVKSISFEDVIKNQWNAQDLPVIGGIAIPDLGINLPIFRGVGNAELTYGAGTMKEDEVMGQGNYALASHHVSALTGAPQLLFTPLERAENNMTIYITNKTTIYQYKITNIKVVTPEHVEVIADHPGKKEITLVTCADLEATHRIIVLGEYVKEFKFDTASDTVKKAFEVKYNQIGNM
ncbi:class A sortase [Pseudolactococcus insecticola]|uniref:Class A sortase n=1 Tax=Pseudolactococcus insecticola TaxID=2709158 RepID=A0A6A0B8U5_9LACT|nr:class A sortase [Lactococcus insecticola]GFH40871.1 class A sortase [Lactococcus insecticola]